MMPDTIEEWSKLVGKLEAEIRELKAEIRRLKSNHSSIINKITETYPPNSNPPNRSFK